MNNAKALDRFLRQQGDSWKQRKQKTFAHNVIHDLLMPFQTVVGQVRQLSAEAGEEGFTCSWFNDSFNRFPARLGCVTLAATVEFTDVILRFKKLTVGSQFEELRCNYPNDYVALVFAYHGDGMPRIVASDLPFSWLEDNEWAVHAIGNVWLVSLGSLVSYARASGFELE